MQLNFQSVHMISGARTVTRSALAVKMLMAVTPSVENAIACKVCLVLLGKYRNYICCPGFMGEKCAAECPEGKFGHQCEQQCLCQNGATCNKINGDSFYILVLIIQTHSSKVKI